MRIGMVCLHTDPFAPPGSGDVGGMNVVVRHTATELAAAGHPVTVWTRLSRPDAPATEVIDGVTLRRLAVGPPRRIAKAEHDPLIELFSAELSLSIQSLASQAPGQPVVDLLHSHHWFSGMAALAVARQLGVAHVQSFHSVAAPPNAQLSAGEPPESLARLDGEALLARASDAVIAVSRAEAELVVERLGAAAELVTVVHPGVDTEQFFPLAQLGEPASKHDQRNQRPVLLTAGRLEPLKGIDLAIATLAEVIARTPPARPRPQLIIAGGATKLYDSTEADYPQQLRAIARQLGVARDVSFVDALTRSELADQLRHSTLMLIPSHSETYGLIALEAAASGVPVVASRAGGLVESVLDGVTGVLLSDSEPTYWATTVADLLADPARLTSLGAAGRAHALTRDWASVAADTLSAYQDVLAGKLWSINL